MTLKSWGKKQREAVLNKLATMINNLEGDLEQHLFEMHIQSQAENSKSWNRRVERASREVTAELQLYADIHKALAKAADALGR
jgi:hypothetical protein